jgi:metal-sulfur cluster biosynthetic enzyme
MDEQLLEALRQVIDPELRINIVDLGLVYSAALVDGDADVAMTLTAPGCPMASFLSGMAEAAIWKQVPGVKSVKVRLVWSPPWQPSMMSEAAKDELGWN